MTIHAHDLQSLATAREIALATHLDCDPTECAASIYDENLIDGPGGEWLVLTEEDAQERAAEYILDTVWAFNADFLSGHMAGGGLTAEHIERLRGDSCEDINEAFVAMLDCPSEFIREALAADGIGHFLAGYDGEEAEACGYFLYRTN